MLGLEATGKRAGLTRASNASRTLQTALCESGSAHTHTGCRGQQPKGKPSPSQKEPKGQLCKRQHVYHTYLGMVVMVQPRQQLDHDAQGPRMHDHSITFIRPADRGEAHQTEEKHISLSLQSLLFPTDLSGSF